MERKLLLLVYVLGAALHGGESVHYEFSPAGSLCIIMDIDATFNLTKTGLDPQEAPLFDLQGDIDTSSSICDTTSFNDVLTINLTPTNERLQFKFSTNGNDVFMSVILDAQLSSHFENDNSTNKIELETNTPAPIGSRNNSYQCSMMTLNFDFDDPYHMIMDIKNLHVQAYDVSGSGFSPVELCSQDVTSSTVTPTTNTPTTNTPTTNTPTTNTPTSKPTTVTDTSPNTKTTATPKTTVTSPDTSKTTQPVTSKTTKGSTTPNTPEPTTNGTTPDTPEPTNGTTPEPSTETPQTTQTTPAPVFAPKFGLLDLNGRTYCIILQGNIELQIPYDKNSSEELGVVSITIPQNATVTGTCSLNGTNTTQQINLSFFNNWMFSLVIGVAEPMEDRALSRRRLLATETSYSWQEIQLSYTVDEHFEDPQDPGSTKTVTTEPTFSTMTADSEGYKCSSKESFDLKDGIMMDLSDLQYRAFGDTDTEDLPTDGVAECDADKNNDDDDDNVGAIVGGVVGGVVFLVILIGVIMYIQKRRRRDYVVM